MNWQIGNVVAVTVETPRVKSLTLDLPAWPGHRAGQHVDVRLTAEDGYQAVRSYSIASPPEERTITITVEELGDGEVSPYLVEEVRVGDQIECRGPIGGYFVWQAGGQTPLFLVGGGSGIVPLMAMIRHRRASGSAAPIRLLYSVRSPGDIIYREELERIAVADEGIGVIFTYTRTAPDAWTGYRRRIDLALLAETVWPAAHQPLAYICGPSAFVEVTAAGLLRVGYAPEAIKTERFGPTGR